MSEPPNFLTAMRNTLRNAEGAEDESVGRTSPYLEHLIDSLDQRTEPRVPVVHAVDARLAEHQTDGWHYEDMPPDGEAWRESLANLEADAELRCGTGFATCGWHDQTAIVQNVQDVGARHWHRLVASHVWSLWTRYVCTAFYAHPSAWEEIGFGGPAYPRGYKNLGIDRREPYEVSDARPAQDPTTGSAG